MIASPGGGTGSRVLTSAATG